MRTGLASAAVERCIGDKVCENIKENIFGVLASIRERSCFDGEEVHVVV